MENKKITAGEVRVILNRVFCVYMHESQLLASMTDEDIMTLADLADGGARLEKSYRRCIDNLGDTRGWHKKHDTESKRLRGEFVQRLVKFV